ncbi:MAG: FKBP-type peptidyl-prolyl cis-trans isomerase [Myxococcales bacterium]|nr:FKBP-type peptidyl-prolyl cis-trans isomerase [Myxococcales bacterium]
MNRLLRLFLAVPLLTVSTVSLGGCNKPNPEGGATKGAAGALATDDQKTLYALGLVVARNISVFNLTPAEVEFVKRGMGDGVSGKKPEIELETWGPKVDEMAKARRGQKSEGEKKKGEEFLVKAAAEPGVVKTPSGLIYKTMTPGTGASPAATDKVKVHYHGTLTDGTVFDSSVKRGEPAEFPLNGVIPCWTEGVQKMKVGEKARLVCPAAIAYGDRGSPPAVPGGATLIFEVELLEIKK